LNGVTLNGYPTLALQVHVIQQLRLFFSGRNRLGSPKKSVGKRTFSVINVCNNAKISYVFHARILSIFWALPQFHCRSIVGRAFRCIFCSAIAAQKDAAAIPNANPIILDLICKYKAKI
jgi:hypothetical protein